MLTERPDRTPVSVADDGKEYHPRYMRRCDHFMDAERGGPGYCGATPTKHFGPGIRCRDHTPAALNGRPEARPDPSLTLTGLREAAGLPATPPPSPASDSRVNDDRAVASGKRRSTPDAYREAKARVAAAAK